jgi:hypothetical protein
MYLKTQENKLDNFLKRYLTGTYKEMKVKVVTYPRRGINIYARTFNPMTIHKPEKNESKRRYGKYAR